MRGRKGLRDLATALPAHDIRQYAWCRTPAQIEAEDDLRTRQLLRPSTLASPLIDDRRAHSLAARLADDDAPETPASSRYMHDIQRRLTGNLLQLIADRPDEPVTVATLMTPTDHYEPEQLIRVSAARMKGALRQVLVRAGSREADGWLFAGLHGEYDPIAGLYRLHHHLVAGGEMGRLVDGLRNTLKYRLPERALGAARPSPSVRMSRGPIENLAYRASYRLQSYWPEKATGDFAGDGVQRRAGGHPRIDEPHHSQHLLWLDQWAVDELTLMVGLQVNAEGRFVRTREAAYTK